MSKHADLWKLPSLCGGSEKRCMCPHGRTTSTSGHGVHWRTQEGHGIGHQSDQSTRSVELAWRPVDKGSLQRLHLSVFEGKVLNFVKDELLLRLNKRRPDTQRSAMSTIRWTKLLRRSTLRTTKNVKEFGSMQKKSQRTRAFASSPNFSSTPFVSLSQTWYYW